MKRVIYILGLFFIMSYITSCGDSYYVENELHGMWQVTSIERKSNEEVKDAQGQLYYLFQRSVVMLGHKLPSELGIADYNIAHVDCIGKDSIAMGPFRKAYAIPETKVLVDSLLKFGLYQDYTIFHLMQTRQKLILTSDSARIELRKY